MGAEGSSWFYLCVSEPHAARVLTRSLRQELKFVANLSNASKQGIFVACSASGAVAHFYFSPSTQTIAMAHNAIPCPFPIDGEVGAEIRSPAIPYTLR